MFGTSDPIDLIVEGREKLAAEDRSGWSTAAWSDRLLAVAAERERLDAELLRLTAAFDARGGWAEAGYASAAAWLAHNAPVTKPAAGRLLRTARHVQRFAATADALADCTVTTDKVEILAESAKHREVFYERDEQVLLDAASRLDVRDLTTAARTWQMLADDELASIDAAKAFDRIEFHVSRTLLGAELAGFLDPQGSVTLTNALDRIEPIDPAHSPDGARTLSQRRGEGLVKLAQFYLDERDAESEGRAVPAIDAVFTVNHHVDGAPLPLEDRRSEITDSGPVPIDTILRLACDARIGWLTINGKREVLDMGRRSRTPTAAQRRAVVARDRHCQYPGCRARARWCDVHHLDWWEHGGPTDLCNLVLLCRRHHVAVHEGARQLVRDPDGTIRVERRARRTRWSRGDPDG